MTQTYRLQPGDLRMLKPTTPRTRLLSHPLGVVNPDHRVVGRLAPGELVLVIAVTRMVDTPNPNWETALVLNSRCELGWTWSAVLVVAGQDHTS